jgi:hypothetical protein
MSPLERREAERDCAMICRNEATLHEILSDPLTRALMRADGVVRHELEAMLARIGNELAREAVFVSNRSRCVSGVNAS